MNVCVWIYMYKYYLVCVCMYVCALKCTYISRCVCMYVCMNVCVVTVYIICFLSGSLPVLRGGADGVRVEVTVCKCTIESVCMYVWDNII
jgi:hypothetical protein